MNSKHLSFLKDYTSLLGAVKGIENSEITEIETRFNINLPPTYKEFLLLFGKESGNLLSSN